MNQLLQKLGPGLLYAGAAIGVSHLVQSTKAGAFYGFALIVAVLIGNILKYPFFEAGPRYASATGKTLIDGYKKQGNWAVVTFLFVTVLTMFIIQAAVTIVTAGLAMELFGLKLDIWTVSLMVLIICGIILSLGNYKLLDKLMKVIMVLLAITTIVAMVLSFGADTPNIGSSKSFSFSEKDMIFLIAFLGWMPAPLDISVWHSVWSKEANKEKKSNLKSSLFDFKIGYWGTVVLAICFVILGANMLHGSGVAIEKSAGGFAKQLINTYTQVLGSWAYPVIGIAAFATMFSTTLTCYDAFPRVLSPTLNALSNKEKSINNYWIWLAIVGIGALIILKFFVKEMGSLVTFITILSFLAAPIIAFLNYKVIFQGDLKPEQQPNKKMKVLAQLGIAFMTILSFYYIITLIK